MKFNELKQIIEILSKYVKDCDNISTGYEELFLPPNNPGNVISKKDLERLSKLGVMVNEEFECLFVYC